MALQAVGIKTYIWNNHFRSLLLLLLYPLVMMVTYVAVIGGLVLYAMSHRHPQNTWPTYTQFLETALVTYWYIPHVLVIVVVLVTYILSKNRMGTLSPDMTLVTRERHPTLYQSLENLCISRGLEMPYFFIQRHPSCNAYTSGLTPHTYQIVVTSTLLETLSEQEVETVLAHELTHLINGDTRFLFLSSTLTNMLATLASWVAPMRRNPTPDLYRNASDRPREDVSFAVLRALVWMALKLGNIGALFVQLFISRKREYIADAGAVELTKNPQALISALQKIEQHALGTLPHADKAALFHHFSAAALLATHPTLHDRIAAIAFYSRIEAPQTRSPWARKEIRKASAAIDQNTVVW